MRNRTQGKSAQLTDLVTTPCGLINFRHAFADVNEYGED